MNSSCWPGWITIGTFRDWIKTLPSTSTECLRERLEEFARLWKQPREPLVRRIYNKFPGWCGLNEFHGFIDRSPDVQGIMFDFFISRFPELIRHLVNREMKDLKIAYFAHLVRRDDPFERFFELFRLTRKLFFQRKSGFSNESIRDPLTRLLMCYSSLEFSGLPGWKFYSFWSQLDEEKRDKILFLFEEDSLVDWCIEDVPKVLTLLSNKSKIRIMKRSSHYIKLRRIIWHALIKNNELAREIPELEKPEDRPRFAPHRRIYDIVINN